MRKNYFPKIAFALVLAGVLTLGGFTIYRLGFMQGAQAAALPFESGGRAGPGIHMDAVPDFFIRGSPAGLAIARVLPRALPGALIFLAVLAAGLAAFGLLGWRLLGRGQAPAPALPTPGTGPVQGTQPDETASEPANNQDE